jgi:dihydroorotase
MTTTRVLKAAALAAALALVPAVAAQTPTYDLILKGGIVIDSRNGINAVRDVAIKDGLVAAVAANIQASATRTADVSGLYVTPGLVDIHVHVYTGERTATYAGGDLSVPPDGFTLRSCVTTVADAGSSGWRTFEDFKRRVIDRSKTRVTAFLNIVGAGMREGQLENNEADMEVQPTAEMAMKHKGVIVGIKSAHYSGPGWGPYEKAAAVGKMANIPVMVDFGSNLRNNRTIAELFTTYFRPGDIYTHMYGGVRGEQDAATKGPSQAFIDGRKKGVILDVGHGGGSFRWSAALPMMKAGFIPDSISTDLHASSMNSGMKNMLDVMSKFLLMGEPLDRVIQQSTWNPAKEIHLDQVGHLSVGAPADVAVLRVENGKFGFMDQINARVEGTQRLTCELTLRDGKVAYDLNGLMADRMQ